MLGSFRLDKLKAGLLTARIKDLTSGIFPKLKRKGLLLVESSGWGSPVEESLLLLKRSGGKGPAYKEGGSFRRRLKVEMGVWEAGDGCKEGGSFRLRRKDMLYSRTKMTRF
jgi:hypothetical protein